MAKKETKTPKKKESPKKKVFQTTVVDPIILVNHDDGYVQFHSSSDFGETLTWIKEGQVFVGTVQKVSEVEVGKGKNKKTQTVLRATDKNGKTYSLWSSAKLGPFFETLNEGDSIKIVYTGEKAIKGQKNPMRDFEMYSKSPAV